MITHGVLGADGQLRVISATNVIQAIRKACWSGPASWIDRDDLKDSRDIWSPLTPGERACWKKLRKFGYRRCRVRHEAL
jgi:hypothetical protein